jgi:hypothetical protein
VLGLEGEGMGNGGMGEGDGAWDEGRTQMNVWAAAWVARSERARARMRDMVAVGVSER